MGCGWLALLARKGKGAMERQAGGRLGGPRALLLLLLLPHLPGAV